MRFLFLVILLGACSGPVETTDAGMTPDSGTSDAGFDAGPPPPCLELLGDHRFAIDPTDTSRSQIHASAAFDGEGIWVAYNHGEPGDTGLFDVYAVRLGCDGRQLIPPFPVQNESAGNDVDPAIAIAGDRILIVWQVDDGSGGTSNLQIRWRAFALDGTPMGDQEQLVTTRAGAPITENHSGADVAVSGDRVVIGGVRAVPDVMRFQAYAQELGAPGDALDSPSEDMVSHRNAAVAIAGDGEIWIAYDREPAVGNPGVYVRSFADPGSIAEPALMGGPAVTGGADLLGSGASVWAAFAGGFAVGTSDLYMVDAALPLAERMPAVIGVAARSDSTPKLAASPEGVLAIAWYRQISGSTHELYAATFTAGNPPVVGTEVLVQGDPGAVFYQPALTYVDDGHWFLAWSEGTSPDLRLMGRILTLP